jgi:hypothetical protein
MHYTITNDDFKFVERPEDDHYTIHLTTGPWTDTKFQFGQVQIHEEDSNDDDGLKVSFDWKLIEGDPVLESDSDFQNYIGDILTHVITDSLDAKIGEMPHDNTLDSDDDTTQSAE